MKMADEKQLANSENYSLDFNSKGGFGLAWQQAQAFASSTMVPAEYRDNPSNCMIAIEMAMRTRSSVFATMQSLAIVKGRPSFSAQFLIGCLNACGKYSPLRFEEIGGPKEKEWAVRAYATEIKTGEKLYGAWISRDMAIKEGWWSKKDKGGNEISKWQTMPEQMFRYRAAAFFVRVYAPEISLGMYTTDELQDIESETPSMKFAGKQEALKEEVAQIAAATAQTPYPEQAKTYSSSASDAATTVAAPAVAIEVKQEAAPAPAVQQPTQEAAPQAASRPGPSWRV